MTFSSRLAPGRDQRARTRLELERQDAHHVRLPGDRSLDGVDVGSAGELTHCEFVEGGGERCRESVRGGTRAGRCRETRGIGEERASEVDEGEERRRSWGLRELLRGGTRGNLRAVVPLLWAARSPGDCPRWGLSPCGSVFAQEGARPPRPRWPFFARNEVERKCLTERHRGDPRTRSQLARGAARATLPKARLHAAYELEGASSSAPTRGKSDEDRARARSGPARSSSRAGSREPSRTAWSSPSKRRGGEGNRWRAEPAFSPPSTVWGTRTSKRGVRSTRKARFGRVPGRRAASRSNLPRALGTSEGRKLEARTPRREPRASRPSTKGQPRSRPPPRHRRSLLSMTANTCATSTSRKPARARGGRDVEAHDRDRATVRPRRAEQNGGGGASTRSSDSRGRASCTREAHRVVVRGRREPERRRAQAMCGVGVAGDGGGGVLRGGCCDSSCSRIERHVRRANLRARERLERHPGRDGKEGEERALLRLAGFAVSLGVRKLLRRVLRRCIVPRSSTACPARLTPARRPEQGRAEPKLSSSTTIQQGSRVAASSTPVLQLEERRRQRRTTGPRIGVRGRRHEVRAPSGSTFSSRWSPKGATKLGP